MATVGELIAKLQTFDPDRHVLVLDVEDAETLDGDLGEVMLDQIVETNLDYLVIPVEI